MDATNTALNPELVTLRGRTPLVLVPVANPQNAVAYQSAAEVKRWRADWRLSQGLSVQTELVEGNRLVEEALASNPGLASAMITDSALKIIQAESEADPRSRSALVAEASASLRSALEVNPLLELETEELRRRIAELHSD